MHAVQRDRHGALEACESCSVQAPAQSGAKSCPEVSIFPAIGASSVVVAQKHARRPYQGTNLYKCADMHTAQHKILLVCTGYDWK